MAGKTKEVAAEAKPIDGLIKRGKIWHMRFTVDGHTVAESTRTSDKREARRIKEARRTELVNQVVLGQLKLIKLHDAIDRFQKSRKGLPSHANAVIQTEPFKKLPNSYLDRVSVAQAMEVIQDRQFKGKSYKKSTDALTVRYFNAMVNHCAEHGYAVCKKLQTVRGVKGKIRWLTEDEEVRFFAAMDSKTALYSRKSERNDRFMDENRDICMMLLYTGARWHEAADMVWSQVNFAQRTVHIKRGKGGNDTTITMPLKLLEMLHRRRQADPDGDYVFARHKGKQCAVAWFKSAVKRANLSQAQGTVTPHTFRHTFAARILHNGQGLAELQEMLGHKNIQSTMIYKHLLPDRAAVRTAAIFDKIDEERAIARAIKESGTLTPEEVASAYAGDSTEAK